MMQHLTRLGIVDQVYIDQCSLGAPSKKPTILGTVRLPQLRAHKLNHHSKCLCKCRPNAEGNKHAKILVGLDEDGSFRAAPAKTYPPGMCELIAKAALDFIKDELSPATEDLPCWPGDLQKFYQPLDPYILRDIGIDCAMFNTASREDFTVYQAAADIALAQAGVILDCALD